MEEKENVAVKENTNDQSVENDDDELDLDDFFGEDDEVAETDETDKTNEDDGKVETADKKKTQTKEERAHFAQLKREQKQKEAEQEEAKRKAELEKVREEATLTAELGVITENPYTKTPIKDKYDLETYKMMVEIVKDGGDPIKDLPAYLSKNARVVGTQAEEQAKKTAEQENLAKEQEKIVREQVNSGFNSIRAKYHCDTKALTADQLFVDTVKELGVLDGKNTVETAYLVYLQKKSMISSSNDDKDKDKIDSTASKVTSTPTAQGRGNSQSSVLDMTDEEYIALQQQKNGDFF